MGRLTIFIEWFVAVCHRCYHSQRTQGPSSGSIAVIRGIGPHPSAGFRYPVLRTCMPTHCKIDILTSPKPKKMNPRATTSSVHKLLQLRNEHTAKMVTSSNQEMKSQKHAACSEESLPVQRLVVKTPGSIRLESIATRPWLCRSQHARAVHQPVRQGGSPTQESPQLGSHSHLKGDPSTVYVVNVHSCTNVGNVAIPKPSAQVDHHHPNWYGWQSEIILKPSRSDVDKNSYYSFGDSCWSTSIRAMLKKTSTWLSLNIRKQKTTRLNRSRRSTIWSTWPSSAIPFWSLVIHIRSDETTGWLVNWFTGEELVTYILTHWRAAHDHYHSTIS